MSRQIQQQRSSGSVYTAECKYMSAAGPQAHHLAPGGPALSQINQGMHGRGGGGGLSAEYRNVRTAASRYPTVLGCVPLHPTELVRCEA